MTKRSNPYGRTLPALSCSLWFRPLVAYGADKADPAVASIDLLLAAIMQGAAYGIAGAIVGAVLGLFGGNPGAGYRVGAAIGIVCGVISVLAAR